MFKKIALLSMMLTLSACSSTGSISVPGMSSEPDIAFSELYLRGVFNWWEASPDYQFTQGNGGWQVDVELIADGQPYDFKVSDENWSPAQSCGGKYKGQPVSLNSTSYLVCAGDSETLQFTPTETGTYRFTIMAASGNEIRLLITRRG
ncbi:hypothetical protein OCL06_03290 [Alteromonas sp. ASW11-19]|uniref:Pullulanase n=1 Tax=Alteromonas salexigens TaxID=2982530 RepID=A0ABT2VK30_9ALTE|nr:hypothetical protein [Alteromonas salexigens]MCU7553623.1 hypothetical protein [Alteromonas salexigens]